MDIDEDDLSAQPLAKLLQSAEALTSTVKSGKERQRRFRPEMIAVQRMNDVASSGPVSFFFFFHLLRPYSHKLTSSPQSTVESLQIHAKLPFLLASGPDSTARVYHLKSQPPNPNPLLTSVHVKGTPLVTTSLHPSTSDPRIFLGGRRRYFHVWNLSSGRVEKISQPHGHQDDQQTMERFKLSPDGTHLALLGSAVKGGGVLNLLNANTLQWVAQARIDSLQGIADFAWWSDSAGLCVAGRNGEITEWSLHTRRAVARWKDEGAVGTTVMALGGDSGRHFLGGDRWIAIGSSAGIVNIYDRRVWATDEVNENANNLGIPTNPTPVKALDNLITSITHLQFTPDGQLLCMASRWAARALRLVHLPTCSVYKNWPTSVTPLGRVASVAWGKNEEGDLMLTVGNENGRILAWEVRGS
jgi:U3 small nucleolar RNA-associated protein 18